MKHMIVLLVLSAISVQTANILAVFPLPGKSHFTMFERLLKALAEKGHNVDVASHFPLKTQFPRYNDLSLRGSLPIFVNNLTISTFENFSHTEMLRFISVNCGTEACKAAFKTPVLQNLRSSAKKYDLVMTEIFASDCMLGFGYLFKTPIISLTSSVSLPWGTDRIGNPDNPSYIPNYFVSYIGKLSLYERFVNTFLLVKSKILYYLYSERESNRIAKEFFGNDLPDLADLAKNTSLILVNSHYSMNQARPTVPNFVEVGGLHIKSPQPLNDYFENLLKFNSTQKGVIYLTMGSMILTESFPSNKLQGLFDAFSQLPYKVLWKGVKDNFPPLNIPDNIHFEPWMPQMDILCHENVQIFVSHGGLMGSQEAVYCGVPRIGIPLFADQETNIRQAEKMGLAVRVDYNQISKETILKAVFSLQDPKFQRNSELASKIFRDRPLSSLETAIYWVEYVIRYKGAPQLRTTGADLNWYEYFLIDIAAGLLLFFYLSLNIFKSIVKFSRRSVVTKLKLQ